METLFLKRFLYLLSVTGIAFSLFFYFHQVNAQWVVWTALFLSLINFGYTWNQRFLSIFILGVITILIGLIGSLVAVSFIATTWYLFLIIFICAFIRQRFPQYFFFVFLISLFAILSCGLFFPANLQQTVFIFCGLSVAASLQIIFWPGFLNNELRSMSMISLQNLRSLSGEIFSCFLHPDYVQNIYLYERRVHEQRKAFMQSLMSLRDIVQQNEKKFSLAKKEFLSAMLIKLDQLFDIVLDGAQLRRRITDFTVFEVCREELKGIDMEIHNIFSTLIAEVNNKKTAFNTKNLAEKIGSLEDIYQNVMQVTSPEPLVFFLFIASLKAFKQEIEGLHGLSQII